MRAFHILNLFTKSLLVMSKLIKSFFQVLRELGNSGHVSCSAIIACAFELCEVSFTGLAQWPAVQPAGQRTVARCSPSLPSPLCSVPGTEDSIPGLLVFRFLVTCLELA